MADGMAIKDDVCDGCYYHERSYSVAPCNACSRAFSGMQKDWYAMKDEDILNEAVKRPKHYKLGNMEAIDIIKKTLTKEQFNGYLLGNILKYRLRAGKKDDTEQDIAKALQYEQLWDMYND